MNTLGKRIKKLREDSRLNQVELAGKLNISNTTLSQYETGNRVPSDEIKISLAEYFDVSLDYLMGVSDIRNYNQRIGKTLNRINKNSTSIIPNNFSTPEEAMQFILKDNTIMGFGGFDVNKLSDEEVVEFANELLNQLRLLSYKYKK